MAPFTRLLTGMAVVLMSGVIAVAAGTAKGTATYKSQKGAITVTFSHAAVVAGPSVVSGKPMRRLVLSTKDVSAALEACDSMMRCSDGGIGEGITMDFEAGEARLGYWFVANDQLVQYSGTVKPESVTLTTDDGKRLAGTVTFDQTASGGPSVQVTFDAPLVKTLGK